MLSLENPKQVVHRERKSETTQQVKREGGGIKLAVTKGKLIKGPSVEMGGLVAYRYKRV